MTHLKHLLSFIASGLLLTGAALALLLMVWHMSGKQVWAVQTNSMTPTFRAGDAILLRTNAKVEPGQVVSYQSPVDSHVLISHRLLKLDPANNLAVTQGDANNQPDPSIPTSRIQGQVTAVLPNFGKLLTLQKQTWALVAFVYIPALIIVGQQAWVVAQNLTTGRYQLRPHNK